MKRFGFALLAFTLMLMLSVAAVSAQGTSRLYTIVFRGNSIPSNAAQLVQNAGGQLLRTHPQVGVASAVSSNPNFAANLSGARGVLAVGAMNFRSLPPLEVQINADAPNPAVDNLFPLQWDIRRVNADQAWAEGYTGSHNTVVSVIDTGVASNHPDLAPNLVYAACYASTPTCSVYPDLHWHGTHVAGTVAATFGGGRVVGVGPNLGLASYNVFEVIPDCGICAYDEPIWAAMLDTASRGFEVINMSLGGTIFRNDQSGNATWHAWSRVANYVARQGVTIVASAGNDNTSSNGPIAHIPSDLSDVISVGATGIRPNPAYPQPGAFDVRAFYSNYGAAVDIAAPGGDCGLPDSCDPATRPANWFNYLVLSSFVTVSPACAATASCPPGYAFAAGTSMASPHVAGVAGLMKDVNPGLNPQQVEARLQQTAQSLGDRQQFGHGMVDALAAVLRVS
jgi:subtilisin family serine protease